MAVKSFYLGIAFLSGLLAWGVFCVPYLPTNDGPQDIASAYIENDYNNPHSIYHTYLERLPQFGARGSSAIMKPLQRWFGWQLGTQLTLLFILLLNALGFSAMVLALNPQRKWLIFLGFGIAWSWNLYMGFFSFAISTGLGYWITAYVLAVKEWRLSHWCLLSSLLVFQAFAHVFPAAMTSVLISCLLVFKETTWRERFRKVGILALVGIPNMLLAGLLFVSWFNPEAHIAGLSETVWIPVEELISTLPRTFFPGFRVVAAVWVLILGYGIVSAFFRLKAKKLSSNETVLLLVSLASIAAAALAPRDLPAWQFFSERFVPLGLSCGLLLIPVERFQRGTHQILFFIVSCTLVANVFVNQKLAEEYGDVTDLISAPKKQSGVLHHIPLISRESKAGIPYLRGDFQVNPLYAVVMSSVPSNLFAGSPAINAFALKKLDPGHPPYQGFLQEIHMSVAKTILQLPEFQQESDFRTNMVTRFALGGMNYLYTGINVIGARDTDVEVFKSLGFVEDWRMGSTWGAHFVPCTLLIQGKALSDVQVGMWPQTDTPVFGGLQKHEMPQGEAYPWVPCGDIWAKVRLSPNSKLSIIDPENRGLPNQVHWIEDSIQ